VLAAEVRGMQLGLEALRADQVPPAEQEPVFSRALPYTIIGGRTDNWIRGFRELNLTGPQPGLYWFGGFERDTDLTRFAGHFPYFTTALEGTFASA
jgi:hypothetical protein